tara:strand:+ start:56 stop:430 length:375 start_codon:yes stop_codon:yes gene_type:complete
MRNYINKAPKNTLRVLANDDLAPNYGKAKYKATFPDGRKVTFITDDTTRQVLDTLIKRPVYCASLVRVGHYVDVLRDELGNEAIRTDWIKPTKPRQKAHGVYSIACKVEHMQNISSQTNVGIQL